MKFIRPVIVGLVVALLFGALGYSCVARVNNDVLATVFRYLTSIIGIIWLFTLSVYGKMVDLTDLPGLNYREHRNLEGEIRAWTHWFWLRGVFLVLMALAINLPQFLADAKIKAPPYTFIIAAIALGWSLVSITSLFGELEAIRRLRSRIKELERADKERAEQSKALGEAVKGGWTPDSHFGNLGRGDSVEVDQSGETR